MMPVYRMACFFTCLHTLWVMHTDGVNDLHSLEVVVATPLEVTAL